MKKKNFTEAQIVAIIHQQEAGLPVKEICREHGISDATFYNWKAKYGGLVVSDVKRLKDLEEENTKLKRIVANLTLENDAIKTVLEKKYGGLTTNAWGGRFACAGKDQCSPGLQNCSHFSFTDFV